MTARWFLVALLWCQALSLAQAVDILSASLRDVSRLRRQLLAAPATAVRSHCRQSPVPAAALLRCQRQLYWWHTGSQAREVCSDQWQEAPSTPRRYHLVLSCSVAAFGTGLQLPLLSTTIFR